MKSIFSMFLAFIPVFFTTCILINNDFDVHTAYFKNDSSRNIYVQHYSSDHNNVEADYYFAYGVSIPRHTIAEYAAPLDDDYLDKILIVDTDTRELLKKVSGTTYYSMLTTPTIIVEDNSSKGKTTFYNYYFVITDEFIKY